MKKAFELKQGMNNKRTYFDWSHLDKINNY